jgi:predicted transglutaminase-like cysteine proteinase
MGLLRQAAFAAFIWVGICGAAQAGGASHAEFGPTLPPYGYIDFCGRTPASCGYQQPAAPLAISPGLLGVIAQVNGYINATVTADTDKELYGLNEFWTLPKGRGDCEDYVLLKKQSLQDLGLPAGVLLITVVLDELLSGHAVLTLRTTEGDLILDNRRDDILPWSKTNYTFLKRQSAENPNVWAALMEQVDLGKRQISASQ